jgi:hypothetical protein
VSAVCVALVLGAARAASAAAGDIVLYAGEAAARSGNWARVSSTTGAGGWIMSSADHGWSTASVPLPGPSDYFELTFEAPANTAFRVWLRLRGIADSKWNESVWVQFSDAVTSAGAPLWRIGTNSGLLVNLENCSGCGIASWGWQDRAWWLGQTAVVQFTTSGSHTIRVQTREDGVQVDQIVLSSATYRWTPPGAVTRDTKVLPKSNETSPVPPAASPFTGTAAGVPGTIQAEAFDTGGEGIGYHDLDSANLGGAYRQTGVDITGSGADHLVGWVGAGEWLNYSIDVQSAGSYTAHFRVASALSGGSFHLEVNGTNVTGAVGVPNTGGWLSWQTVTRTITLAAGRQTARLVMDAAPQGAVGNFDSIQLTSAGGAAPPASTGQTISVPAGGDLQAALNAAQPGDTILLAPGATYSGEFVLPAKSGSSYVTIRSAAPDSSLPPAGVRMTPAYAPQLPRVRGIAGAPAFSTAPGAHHWRLQFLELVSAYYNSNILELGRVGSAQNTLAAVPHNLVVDRCYIHGDPSQGQKRGIALNSASTSIIDSYISDIKSSVSDSQAIAGWNGPGPYTITNNFLEATGENVLFGGADPSIPNLVPSDITLSRNHITKSLGWRSAGWIVKNLVELKNAQRVRIDGNLIEHSWMAGQTGYAIVLTPRNQDGTAPWSVVRDVAFTNNVVRRVAGGFTILGSDNLAPSQHTTGITIRNNLFLEVSKATYGGTGWLMVLTGGPSNVTVDHNTLFTDGTSVVLVDGPPVTGFVFTSNIVPDNSWAIFAANYGMGLQAIAARYPGSTFLRNVFVGGSAATYPAGNYYPSSLAAVGFVNLAGGDYRLAAVSPYAASALDGTAIGCNITTLNTAAGTAY